MISRRGWLLSQGREHHGWTDLTVPGSSRSRIALDLVGIGDQADEQPVNIGGRGEPPARELLRERALGRGGPPARSPGPGGAPPAGEMLRERTRGRGAASTGGPGDGSRPSIPGGQPRRDLPGAGRDDDL